MGDPHPSRTAAGAGWETSGCGKGLDTCVQEVGFHPHEVSKPKGESTPGVSELFSYSTRNIPDLQLLSTADPWAASLLVEEDEISTQAFL